MMAEHTPEPWYHSDEKQWGSVTTRPDGRGDVICTCHNVNNCNSEVVIANARLIAAAPRLLADLQRVVAAVVNHLDGADPGSKKSRDKLQVAISQALAIICDLTGGPP